MSTINTASQNQLDTILKKLGVDNEKTEKSNGKDTLGQKDFLTLMTTQLRSRTRIRLRRWKTLNSLPRWHSFPR